MIQVPVEAVVGGKHEWEKQSCGSICQNNVVNPDSNSFQQTWQVNSAQESESCLILPVRRPRNKSVQLTRVRFKNCVIETSSENTKVFPIRRFFGCSPPTGHGCIKFTGSLNSSPPTKCRHKLLPRL